MSAPSVSRPVRAVAYFRMSTQDQDDSIPQQIEWAEKAAERERVAIVERFADEGVKGHDTRKRTAFHAGGERIRNRFRTLSTLETHATASARPWG